MFKNASISPKLECKDKSFSATDNIWLKTVGKYLKGKYVLRCLTSIFHFADFLQVKLQKQKFLQKWLDQQIGTQFKCSSAFKFCERILILNPIDIIKHQT